MSYQRRREYGSSSERSGGGSRSGGYRGGSGGRGGPYDQRRQGYRGGRGGGSRGAGSRGAGSRGGRGGGRGGSRGGRGRGRGPKVAARWHDCASKSLNASVERWNADFPGLHMVKAEVCGEWSRMQSVTKGRVYWRNQKTGESRSKQPSDWVEGQVQTTWVPYDSFVFSARPMYEDMQAEDEKESRGGRAVSLPDTFGVVSNSFEVSGALMSARVRMYLVKFDPPVPPENVEFREAIVMGRTRSERVKNCSRLRDRFGEFVFDNLILYALGKRGGSSSSASSEDTKTDGDELGMPLHKDYAVSFEFQESCLLSDKQLPLERQEALLNIFNRRKLTEANYTRIGRGWFLKSSRTREISLRSPDPRKCPDLSIIPGFECSVRFLPKNDRASGLTAVLKADLNHKLVEAESLNHRLTRMRREMGASLSAKEWQSRAEQSLVGKHFVLSYSKRSLTIAAIDWSATENSSFELKDGGRITYKEYLKKAYALSLKEKEMCVVTDRRGDHFLPQTMRLTVTTKEAELMGEDIQSACNPRINERFQRIGEFVRSLRESGESHFSISSKAMDTQAMRLREPLIMIQGERGPTKPVPINMLQYKMTRGFLNGTRQLRQWCVVYDDRDEHLADCLFDAWEGYTGRRRFDRKRGPILEPQFRKVRSLHSNEQGWHRAIQKGDQFCLLILPDGMAGSELKARFTRCVQSSKFHNPVQVQCVLSSTCRNSSALVNVFEDVMIKAGNIPYALDPALPSRSDSFIDTDSTWVAGIDVSHVSGKPSVMVVSLSRRPFEGSMRNVHLAQHLNPPRKELASLEAMVQLMKQVLDEALAAEVAARDGPARLPTALLVFRDGVADSQFSELFSKEICGVQRAVSEAKRSHKNRRKKQKRVPEWPECRVMFVVCTKSCIDRFATADPRRGGSLSDVQCSCVVFDHVLSYRLWDFVIVPFHPKKRGRTRGVRYVVLLDELGIAESAALGAAADLFQFIYSLSYMFAFSVPFPLGGTAQPGPVQYAKHYAETCSQMIFNEDSNISDLRLHLSLPHRPKLVTDQPKVIQAGPPSDLISFDDRSSA